MISNLSGIYKIQSKVKPNRCYIGSATNLRTRKNDHFGLLRKEKHYSKKLQNHFNKYGENDLIFTVLISCEKENLIKYEQFFIDSYNPWFNLQPIAYSWLGCHHTEETKKKLREANIGKKFTEERKLKLREYHKNNPMSEETRKKMSVAHKGKARKLGFKHSEESKRKMSEFRKNKKHIGLFKKGMIPWNKGKTGIYSISSLNKMKETKKGNKYSLGHHFSEESKEKMSKANKAWRLNKKLNSFN